MTVIGIDPGLKGGIAILDCGSMSVCMPMPTIKKPTGKGNMLDLGAIRSVMDGWVDKHIYIERQQAMPGQGVVSMFSIGFGQGAFEGLCVGAGFPYTVVRARAWQKVMFESMPKSDTKAASVLVAKRIYPSIEFKATPRCNNYHDGMTDSCLIATYGWRQLNGERANDG